MMCRILPVPRGYQTEARGRQSALRVGDPCLLMKSSHLPLHHVVEMGCSHAFPTVQMSPKPRSALSAQMEMEFDQISRSGHSLAKGQVNVIAVSGWTAAVKGYAGGMSAWAVEVIGCVTDAPEAVAIEPVFANASEGLESENLRELQLLDAVAEGEVASPHALDTYATGNFHEKEGGRVNKHHVAKVEAIVLGLVKEMALAMGAGKRANSHGAWAPVRILP